ncbi:MAG: signal transduction histidine kinase [Yoonia sp.]|jgi:signal transduction histidine kinase
MLKSAGQYDDLQKTSNEAATLRTLNAFAVDLISIPSVADLFWYIAQNVVGRLKFVDCVIYQADDAQTELVQVAALGEKNPFGRSIINPLQIPFGQGITGQVAQNWQAIVVDDLLKDQNYIVDTQLARSEICVPIICGNRIVGVIDSEHPAPAAFGTAELEILETIAAMTSAKLDLLTEADRSKRRYHDLVEVHAQLSQETTSRKSLEAKLFDARKLEAVGSLTGRFAHEFNNLLTVISGNLDFIKETSGDDVPLDPLHDAQAAAQRGSELIKSMLVFSQRSKLSSKVVDIKTVISALCAPFATDADHQVHMNFAAPVDLVKIDVALFQTALSNLLNNARDVMPAGGPVHITTENFTSNFLDQQPFASAILPGRYVRISVQDSGCGISQDRLAQIFDPFYTTKPIGSGTGLGLSMTLGFMQQSGGTVAVHSDVGQGSTFQLYFPAASKDESDLLTI